jgi:Lrp/AsnC family transcriptional regulator for asnA, asnC and gidA
MPKKGRKWNLSVDERDLQILGILEEDARIPWRQLAKRLGVSETTIYLRVNKLIERGILRGFSAVINPHALGLRYSAFVLLKVRAAGYQKLREMLKKKKFVARVYEITGQYNFLVEVLAPDQDSLLSIIDELSETGYVEEVLVLSILRKLWENNRIITGLLGYTP